jgi:2-polyprenyl-6-methoxyphenol hydroxylase-like FAD-dependent oxidoreductase
MTCDVDVLIIGAGPVGLVAALDLDAKGVRTMVVEERAFLQPPEVKSNHVASRTMERFRRLGIADRIRDAGLPHDHPHDIAFLTTMTGAELSRILLPSRDGRRAPFPIGADTSWATPEPPHRINQTFLEPILARRVAELSHVALRNRMRFLSFEQDAEGVQVRLQNLETGGEEVVRARYLLGADGSRSAIRKAIGATLRGDAVLSHVQSTCIRAPHLYELMSVGKAWCYYTYNPRRNGHVFSIDGEGTFLVHNYLTEAEHDRGDVDRDASIRTILGVDESFEYDILSEEDWTARRLVVDRMRRGRVFIAGDAAHLWVPYAGFGMNAGIADALNLTWLIGGVVNGWADEQILDAFEAERLPITEQVSRFAMDHQRKVSQADVPPEIEHRSTAGEAARRRIGELAYELNVRQFAAEGLNYGYSYDGSPVIRYDGETAPSYSMDSYTPSTAPGCRAPHFTLPDGTSVYDRFGSAYTLISFAEPEAVRPLVAAAAMQRVPLEVIDARGSERPDAYVHDLVLVREDQHVAWRGNSAPTGAEALFQQLRGVLTS